MCSRAEANKALKGLKLKAEAKDMEGLDISELADFLSDLKAKSKTEWKDAFKKVSGGGEAKARWSTEDIIAACIDSILG